MNSWYAVNDFIYVSVSTGAPVLPRTETSWEGKGVQPDFVTSPGKEIEFIIQTVMEKEMSSEMSADAFKQLSSLIGVWEGKFEDVRPHSVSYRLTAGGTVLVETWTLGAGRESMTLYHKDGESLFADHYCPQGNQIRLRLIKGGGLDKLSFEFRDGTNLQVKGKSHQQAFWIKINGQNSFARSETYVENGDVTKAADIKPGETVTYTRIKTAN